MRTWTLAVVLALAACGNNGDKTDTAESGTDSDPPIATTPPYETGSSCDPESFASVAGTWTGTCAYVPTYRSAGTGTPTTPTDTATGTPPTDTGFETVVYPFVLILSDADGGNVVGTVQEYAEDDDSVLEYEAALTGCWRTPPSGEKPPALELEWEGNGQPYTFIDGEIQGDVLTGRKTEFYGYFLHGCELTR